MPAMELLCKLNPLTAYLFDACVTHFGLTIENALHETYKVQMGKHTEDRPRYTLTQLLDLSFYLPRPQPEKTANEVNPLQALMALAGSPHSGVKSYRYAGPEPKPS